LATRGLYTLSLHDALPIWVLLEVSGNETDVECVRGFARQRPVRLRQVVHRGGIETPRQIAIANAMALDLGAGKHQGAERKVILRSEEHTSELQSRENLVCR